MKLQLKIDNGVIVDAKFKTFGCGSAIASSSLATEWVKARPLMRQWRSKCSDCENSSCRLSRYTALCLRKMLLRLPLKTIKTELEKV
jgi:NifU-like protein involved in Fe-S cluster formation